jgi:hypothetical protein
MNKAQLADLFRRMDGQLKDGLRMTVKGLTAEGNRVAVEIESHGELKNGRIYNQDTTCSWRSATARSAPSASTSTRSMPSPCGSSLTTPPSSPASPDEPRFSATRLVKLP